MASARCGRTHAALRAAPCTFVAPHIGIINVSEQVLALFSQPVVVLHELDHGLRLRRCRLLRKWVFFGFGELEMVVGKPLDSPRASPC